MGTYQPDDKDVKIDIKGQQWVDALVDLNGLTNIEIQGGFEGKIESKTDQQAKLFSHTIFSGKLKNKIDSTGQENALHVVRAEYDANNTDTLVTIRGLKIQEGKQQTESADGGGLYIVNAKSANTGVPGILLQDLVLSNNSATNGGALSLSRSMVLASNVTFTGNRASENGGAIFSRGNTTLDGGTILENKAVDGAGVMNSGTLTAKGVTFAGNRASKNGGAIYKANGKVTLSEKDKSLFVNNFPDQDASGFQGVYLFAGETLDLVP